MPPVAPRRRVGLRLLQLTLLVTTVLAVAMVIANTPYRFQQLAAFCTTACVGGQLAPSDAPALAQMGLSLPVYAALQTGSLLVFALVAWIVAGVLIWRRPNDFTAVLAALTLVAQAASAGLGETALLPGWDVVLTLSLLAWFAALVNLLYLFPDGRFVPRWTRWAFAPWVAAIVLGVGYVIAARADLPDWFWAGLLALTFAIFALGGLAQIYRYRRVSDRVQRQQTKWVVAGFTVFIAFELLSSLYNEQLRPAFGLPGGGLGYELVTTTLTVLTLLAVPLSIGGAILRYRLWDIDLVIRRTLVYSLLTALLAAAYFGSVALLQKAAALLTGQEHSALVTVLSTLLIAALFAPVRQAVQRFIDRRFFRRRYDAARTLAAFAATLRDDVKLEELSADLLQAVDDSMQPEHAALWVRGNGL